MTTHPDHLTHREAAVPSPPAGGPAATVPTPRPTFDRASAVPASSVPLHLWGDEESGQVADWIYASTAKIHHLVFALAPGKWFRHSPAFRTVFAADELLTVLTGSMVLVNPEVGEVRRVERGRAVCFARDTWHHAYSVGDEPLRVLEFFAPPPAAGTSSSYAKTRPYLDTSLTADDRWLGRWPAAAAEREAGATLRVVGDRDVLWSLAGTGVLVAIQLSTEHLTAGFVELDAGAVSTTMAHGGDASYHVIDGEAFALLEEIDGEPAQHPRWFHLRPDDGFFVPEGTTYSLHNISGRRARLAFAVAPQLRPGG